MGKGAPPFPDTRTRCSWPSVLTTGTLQSSLRTSAKVSRESQGLARPSPQLRRPPVCVWSPGRQALTKPGRATERPAGSRTWGTVLPRGQAGPAPQARALPPSRGLAGFPSLFCTTEASVATALSEKPSPRTNSLMLHAHLRCTPRVAGVKDACLRAHSGAAGRDPSCQSLLPNSRNTSGLRTEAASVLGPVRGHRSRRDQGVPAPRPGRHLPPKPAAEQPSADCRPAQRRGGPALQNRRPLRPKPAGEEAGRAVHRRPSASSSVREGRRQHPTASRVCQGPLQGSRSPGRTPHLTLSSGSTV